jgi:hypothetical protein
MKHLKTFESFSINEEEDILGGVKKFFTGHESSDAKGEAKNKFMVALEEAEKELMAEPDEYPQAKKWEKSKEDLIKQAEEDNFKGGLRVQSSRTGGTYVIYKSGVTGFQSLVSGSSNRTANPLG